MAARSLEKMTSTALYLAKDAKALALTDNFKMETFGISSSVPAMAPQTGGGSFRSGGKYKYVRSEIGERPTLEEE